ncbi:YigZ family protein [Spongiactinospora sp. TRM90649]|uniref:IMPACT family protein n=1 Tax=Spongiactinospora sp. TRM90649 TaxID=3031114 RepID=UPI0023F93CF1|nr:YigZ family protein [Spongiactinospora sp. TRM90649]MDF5757978.1 YigZ family protein [Spongiactinospora sp. TRM90649]
MAEPYLTVSEIAEHETEARGSRFLCAVARVRDEAGARAFVEERRRAHPGAAHTCSAFAIGGDRSPARGDDDGEPGGTAGAPMLDTLVRRGFSDTVAVVTRYFGGVLLGAGGLVRAYGRAVGETLDAVSPVRMVPAVVVSVSIGHAHAGRLENDLRASPYEVLGVRYGADVAIEAAVGEPEVEGFAEWVASATAGGARLSRGPVVFTAAR